MSGFRSFDELADTVIELCAAGFLEATEYADGEIGFGVTEAGREALFGEEHAERSWCSRD